MLEKSQYKKVEDESRTCCFWIYPCSIYLMFISHFSETLRTLVNLINIHDFSRPCLTLIEACLPQKIANVVVEGIQITKRLVRWRHRVQQRFWCASCIVKWTSGKACIAKYKKDSWNINVARQSWTNSTGPWPSWTQCCFVRKQKLFKIVWLVGVRQILSW